MDQKFINVAPEHLYLYFKYKLTWHLFCLGEAVDDAANYTAQTTFRLFPTALVMGGLECDIRMADRLVSTLKPCFILVNCFICFKF